MVWIEFDNDQARRLAFRQRCDDVLDRGLRGKLDGAVPQAQSLGAQANLRHGFFTRDIDRAMADAGQCRRGLNEEGRFADARIAAHQQDGAAYKAAARYAIQFADAGGQTRGIMRVAGKRLERK